MDHHNPNKEASLSLESSSPAQNQQQQTMNNMNTNTNTNNTDEDSLKKQEEHQAVVVVVVVATDAVDIDDCYVPIDENNNKLSNQHQVHVHEHDLGHEEEEEYKATTLELFSDLVVVVAIHIVAETLEDLEYNGDDDAAHNNNNVIIIIWYIIHVFQIWLVWHVSMINFHISHLFDASNTSIHYFVVLIWMTAVLQLARAQASSSNEDEKLALLVYLVIRILEVLAFYIQTHYRNPPPGFDPTRLSIFRAIPFTMIPWVLFGEVIPLLLAIYFSNDDNGQPYLPLVLFSCGLIVIQRTAGAIKGDKLQQHLHEHEKVKVFDDRLLEERYELVNLIFIGELAFASTIHSEETTSLASLTLVCLAMMAAFGCYLLSFVANPHNSTSCWSQSGLRIITTQHFYAGLFIVTPGVAAGIMQIGASFLESQEEEEEYADYDEYSLSAACEPQSGWLLSISTCLFLIFSGLIHAMSVDDETTKSHLSSRQRLLVRFLFAISSLADFILPPNLACVGVLPLAGIVCPVLLVTAACVEVWAVQEANLQFSLTDALATIYPQSPHELALLSKRRSMDNSTAAAAGGKEQTKMSAATDQRSPGPVFA